MIDDDLIDRLCAIAGAIMEDKSFTAVTTGSPMDRTAKVERIKSAARDCLSLAMTADVLDRRMRENPKLPT